jgi:ParB family chromosome partitioning protein
VSKKHDAVFDDILSGLAREKGQTPAAGTGHTRFLKRSTTIGDRMTGELEEKTLHWVDPAECRMWSEHNRAYGLLNEDTCRDLIDGIRAQGRQEFPAIVRRAPGEGGTQYEVICGARRHFAVSWLRANNYPQFKYLIEVRDLTDEEAFRLADIENRDREDISDYERATDYAKAVAAYYGGRQKTMAKRLEVSEAWLSRYLQMARLPAEVIGAYASIRDIRELHARQLKPLLADDGARDRVLAAAAQIAADQAAARDGQGPVKDGAQVTAALRAAGAGDKAAGTKEGAGTIYRRSPGESGIRARKRGRSIVMEFPEGLSTDSLEAAFASFLLDYRASGQKLPTGKK